MPFVEYCPFSVPKTTPPSKICENREHCEGLGGRDVGHARAHSDTPRTRGSRLERRSQDTRRAGSTLVRPSYSVLQRALNEPPHQCSDLPGLQHSSHPPFHLATAGRGFALPPPGLSSPVDSQWITHLPPPQEGTGPGSCYCSIHRQDCTRQTPT